MHFGWELSTRKDSHSVGILYYGKMLGNHWDGNGIFGFGNMEGIYIAKTMV